MIVRVIFSDDDKPDKYQRHEDRRRNMTRLCPICHGSGQIGAHYAFDGWADCSYCDSTGYDMPPKDDRGKFRKRTPEEINHRNSIRKYRGLAVRE